MYNIHIQIHQVLIRFGQSIDCPQGTGPEIERLQLRGGDQETSPGQIHVTAINFRVCELKVSWFSNAMLVQRTCAGGSLAFGARPPSAHDERCLAADGPDLFDIKDQANWLKTQKPLPHEPLSFLNLDRQGRCNRAGSGLPAKAFKEGPR